MNAMPKPVAAYFAATNKHDISGILASFSGDAVVKDEGREHRGLKAIGEWATETMRKYDFTVEPTGVEETKGTTVVAAIVSGTFPGSPLRLRYVFFIDGKGISRLEIA
jgi:SnoaL-like domain